MKISSDSKRLDLVYAVFFWTLFGTVAGKISDSIFAYVVVPVILGYLGNRALTDPKTASTKPEPGLPGGIPGAKG